MIRHTFLILIFFVNVAHSKVFISNNDESKVIELGQKSSFCDIHKDEYKIHQILRKNQVVIVDDDVLNEIELRCLQKEEYGFIFPGTLWCGRGSKAQNYDELGLYHKEDECCRDHDHCGNSLKSGECIENICNNSPYTRSHCECDLKFQKCLGNLNTMVANAIGAIFFNIVKMKCFEEDDCFERRRLKICSIQFRSTPKYPVSLIGQATNFFRRFFKFG